MSNFIFVKSNPNALNDKSQGRRFYLVETAEFETFNKSTSREIRVFIDSLKSPFKCKH